MEANDLKKTTVMAVVTVALIVTSIVSYRTGFEAMRHRRIALTEPLDVVIPGGSNDLADADRLIIQLDGGKKITIDLRLPPRDELVIFAGDYPPAKDDPMWHSLIVRPSAGNVIRLAVESHKKIRTPNKPSEPTP